MEQWKEQALNYIEDNRGKGFHKLHEDLAYLYPWLRCPVAFDDLCQELEEWLEARS